MITCVALVPAPVLYHPLLMGVINLVSRIIGFILYHQEEI